MVKLSRIRVDTDKAQNGVWKDWNGIGLLIARIHTPHYQEVLQRHIEPVLHIVSENGNSCSEAQEATNRAISEAVLLDWRNLEGDDGEPLEYSPEKAYELLTDPELVDLHDFVIIAANSRENYRRVELEKTAKN